MSLKTLWLLLRYNLFPNQRCIHQEHFGSYFVTTFSKPKVYPSRTLWLLLRYNLFQTKCISIKKTLAPPFSKVDKGGYYSNSILEFSKCLYLVANNSFNLSTFIILSRFNISDVSPINSLAF